MFVEVFDRILNGLVSLLINVFGFVRSNDKAVVGTRIVNERTQTSWSKSCFEMFAKVRSESLISFGAQEKNGTLDVRRFLFDQKCRMTDHRRFYLGRQLSLNNQMNH